MTERLRIQGERFTHKDLWYTARWLMRSGLEEPVGSSHKLLAATLFSYLAFESYLNAVLEEVSPEIWRDERRHFAEGPHRGTLGKFYYLAELANHHTVDKSRRPFQTIGALAKARDFLAHARVEHFDALIAASTIDDPRPIALKTMSFSEPAFVKMAMTDVEAVADALHAALVAARGGEIIAGSYVGAFAGVTGSYDASEP